MRRPSSLICVLAVSHRIAFGARPLSAFRPSLGLAGGRGRRTPAFVDDGQRRSRSKQRPRHVPRATATMAASGDDDGAADAAAYSAMASAAVDLTDVYVRHGVVTGEPAVASSIGI